MTDHDATLDTDAQTPTKRPNLYVNLADVTAELDDLAAELTLGQPLVLAIRRAKHRLTQAVDTNAGDVVEFGERLCRVLFKGQP